MGQVVAGMTMSLDGFVADPSGRADRLDPDLASLQGSDYMNAAVKETGAVLPHHPPPAPPRQDELLTFTFVNDGVASAVAQAKAAAGDKAVQVVGGANVIQQLLRAGLVDQLDVDIMPVLLDDGLRLLENIDPGRVRLETLDVQSVGQRTRPKFRVVNEEAQAG
jgi:dihydrofolate reductase